MGQGGAVFYYAIFRVGDNSCRGGVVPYNVSLSLPSLVGLYLYLAQARNMIIGLVQQAN